MDERLYTVTVCASCFTQLVERTPPFEVKVATG